MRRQPPFLLRRLIARADAGLAAAEAWQLPHAGAGDVRRVPVIGAPRYITGVSLNMDGGRLKALW